MRSWSSCRAVVENAYDTLDIAWLYAWTGENIGLIQCMGTLVREGLVRQCKAEKKSKCHVAFTRLCLTESSRCFHAIDATPCATAGGSAARLGQHGRVVAEK